MPRTLTGNLETQDARSPRDELPGWGRRPGDANGGGLRRPGAQGQGSEPSRSGKLGPAQTAAPAPRRQPVGALRKPLPGAAPERPAGTEAASRGPSAAHRSTSGKQRGRRPLNCAVHADRLPERGRRHRPPAARRPRLPTPALPQPQEHDGGRGARGPKHTPAPVRPFARSPAPTREARTTSAAPWGSSRLRRAGRGGAGPAPRAQPEVKGV